MFGPHNDYPTISTLHCHISTLSCTSLTTTFTAVTLHPFAGHSDLELSFWNTHKLVFGSPTQLESSERAQWRSTIWWFNSEHTSFQHSHALSLTICVANTVSYAASCLCICWMWEFAASNADAHANKQTITATCLNERFQSEFLVCFLSSAQ